MKLVQILLAGICLRRTKTSTIDGKPILASLPPKTIHHDIVHFSPAEREFYTALEQRTRLRFNKYLREGRVLQNYANILALLSRLRQAVCHPSLIKVGMAGVGDGGDVADRNGDARDEEALARKLPADAINRVKEQGLTALECAICMDEAIPIQDGVFLSGCGHPYCRLCIESFIEEGAPNGCPLCRAEVDEDVSKLVPFITFQRLFMPETINKGPEPVDDDDDEEEEESDEDAPEFQSSAKIDRCLEILENIRAQGKGEKAICFTQWRGMHKLLGTAMARRGMKYVSIDGSLSIKRRAEAVDIFAADPKCNILIISLKCGSLGLNLTCANHVILTDCWWNPQIEAQAMDRAHRFGQLKPVSVHRITVHETVEDRIMELQEQKQKVFDAAFDGGSLKKIGGRLNIQDLIKLFGRDDDDPLAYSDEDEA